MGRVRVLSVTISSKMHIFTIVEWFNIWLNITVWKFLKRKYFILQNIKANPIPLVLETQIFCLCGDRGINGKDDLEVFIVLSHFNMDVGNYVFLSLLFGRDPWVEGAKAG